MRRLSVFIEINGESVYVGEIAGKDSTDACFTYANTYLENPEHYAISIGLPLEEKTFDAARTRIFFEGLLPEGFTRRCVAEWYAGTTQTSSGRFCSGTGDRSCQ